MKLLPTLLQKQREANDPVAKRIFEIIGEYIGIGLTSVVNLLNPEKIIVGGGVAECGELILDPIRRTIKNRAMVIAGEAVEVVPALLGNSAGVIGASMLIDE